MHAMRRYATAILREHIQDMHVDVISPVFGNWRWPTRILEIRVLQHVHAVRSIDDVSSVFENSAMAHPYYH